MACLTVVLPGGEIVSTPLAPRIGIGPDLKQLIIGSEGAFGVVTEVTLKIFPISAGAGSSNRSAFRRSTRGWRRCGKSSRAACAHRW